MSNIDSTLNERGDRYGEFAGHANVTQNLKRVMGQHPGWRKLKDDQKEALEMTAHKIGRILNGDPDYIDSWHDIIGYVRLVEQRLEKEQNVQDPAKAKTDPRVLGAGLGASLKAPQDQPAGQASTFGGLNQHLGRAIADLARQKREADNKSIETCDCPACTMERDLKAMFPGAEIEVHFLSEDTGRID